MPSRAGTHPTRLWGRYENGRRKYVSQKERQKNETGRKKIRRDAQGRVAALAAFEGLPVGVFRGRRHLPFGRGPAHAVCGPGLHTYRRWHTDERHAHRPVGLYHSNGLVPEAGRQGRAGTLVPITGFANAVVSLPSNSATRGSSPAWVQKCSSSQGLSSFTACWPALYGA